MPISPISPGESFASRQLTACSRSGVGAARRQLSFRFHCAFTEGDIPEDAALDELEHVPVERVRTTLEAGLEHPTGRGKCRGRNRARVFDRRGERRLAIDVFSSLQRRKCNIAMFGCRRRDDDGFDLWGFDHTPPLGRQSPHLVRRRRLV